MGVALLPGKGVGPVGPTAGSNASLAACTHSCSLRTRMSMRESQALASIASGATSRRRGLGRLMRMVSLEEQEEAELERGTRVADLRVGGAGDRDVGRAQRLLEAAHARPHERGAAAQVEA